MPKKKSYMNTENIISEGLISKLINFLIPRSVKSKINKSKIDKLEKQNQKLEKDIESSRKKQSDAYDRMIKSLEKQFGVKVNKKSADDYLKKLMNK